MENCKRCDSEISLGKRMSCPNCGATMCSDCAEKTLRICPYCYHDLECSG